LPRTLSEKDIAAFREKLCAVATRLFVDNGLEGVTMRGLASALGVSAMTPYRYFKDKGEILATVRARAFEQLTELLEKALNTPGSAIERGRAMRDAYIDYALKNPDSYRLMFIPSTGVVEKYPSLRNVMDRAYANLTTFAKALVDEGMAAGDPELVGYIFWSTLHGVISLQLARKIKPEYTIEKIVETAHKTLIAGFQASIAAA
jgi:AcrR family transcriptional regulator